MKPLSKHIILIGFKHVGKTEIGKALALKLKQNFIDNDTQIEKLYENEHNERLNCREILLQHKEPYFRELECRALATIMQLSPQVIAVGGGTPMRESNQALLKQGYVIHITAPEGIVFERIIVSGRPGFFSENESLLTSFHRLWEERQKVYVALKNWSLENNGPVGKSVNAIINQLKEEKII